MDRSKSVVSQSGWRRRNKLIGLNIFHLMLHMLQGVLREQRKEDGTTYVQEILLRNNVNHLAAAFKGLKSSRKARKVSAQRDDSHMVGSGMAESCAGRSSRNKLIGKTIFNLVLHMSQVVLYEQEKGGGMTRVQEIVLRNNVNNLAATLKRLKSERNIRNAMDRAFDSYMVHPSTFQSQSGRRMRNKLIGQNICHLVRSMSPGMLHERKRGSGMKRVQEVAMRNFFNHLAVLFNHTQIARNTVSTQGVGARTVSSSMSRSRSGWRRRN